MIDNQEAVARQKKIQAADAAARQPQQEEADMLRRFSGDVQRGAYSGGSVVPRPNGSPPQLRNFFARSQSLGSQLRAQQHDQQCSREIGSNHYDIFGEASAAALCGDNRPSGGVGDDLDGAFGCFDFLSCLFCCGQKKEPTRPANPGHALRRAITADFDERESSEPLQGVRRVVGSTGSNGGILANAAHEHSHHEEDLGEEDQFFPLSMNAAHEHSGH